MLKTGKAIFCGCLLLGTMSYNHQIFAYRGEAKYSTNLPQEGSNRYDTGANASSNEVYSGNRYDTGTNPYSNEMYNNNRVDTQQKVVPYEMYEKSANERGEANPSAFREGGSREAKYNERVAEADQAKADALYRSRVKHMDHNNR